MIPDRVTSNIKPCRWAAWLFEFSAIIDVFEISVEDQVLAIYLPRKK
jgi:hypothetical protein